MSNNELNLNEMEGVTGGDGGYSKKPADKAGYIIYQIKGGDSLIRIAARYNTTVDAIMNANKGALTNRNFIRAGFYIYIPQ